MNEDQIIEYLSGKKALIDPCVLVREVKATLDIGQPYFHPSIRIKLWKDGQQPTHPYSFTLSHYANTPAHEGQYRPTANPFATETEAISMALHSLLNFISLAIEQGHTPTDKWLEINPEY